MRFHGLDLLCIFVEVIAANCDSTRMSVIDINGAGVLMLLR